MPPEQITQAALVRGFAFRGQIVRIEIDHIDVFDAALGRLLECHVPHGLGNRPGDQPGIGQADVIEPRQEFG